MQIRVKCHAIIENIFFFGVGGWIKDYINEIFNSVLKEAFLSSARSGPWFVIARFMFKSRFGHQLAGFCNLPVECLRQVSAFGSVSLLFMAVIKAY